MTSSYDARGRRVGATILEVLPNFVTQVKLADSKDGYNGVQIGMGSRKVVKKPQMGHFKKANIDQPLRYLREVRVETVDVEPGQEIILSQVFSKGDSVKVTGVTKGRGFQGGVKRHNFHGGPKTHGQSDRHRAPGSIGQGTTPGRVYKGKRMAGHMGVDQMSYWGLEVIAIDKANNLITIKGGIPGPTGGLVVIQKQGRIKGYTPPPEEKEDEEEESSDQESKEEVSAEAAEVVEEQGQPEADETGKADDSEPEGETDAKS